MTIQLNIRNQPLQQHFCLISELASLKHKLLWTKAAVLFFECRSEQNACTLILFEALRN